MDTRAPPLTSTAACDRAKSSKAAPPPPPTTVIVAEVVAAGGAHRSASTPRARKRCPPSEVRARVAGVLEEVLFKEGAAAGQGGPDALRDPARGVCRCAGDRAGARDGEGPGRSRAPATSVVDRYRATLNQRKADHGRSQQDVNRYRPLAEARSAIPQRDLGTALSRRKGDGGQRVAAAESRAQGRRKLAPAHPGPALRGRRPLGARAAIIQAQKAERRLHHGEICEPVWWAEVRSGPGATSWAKSEAHPARHRFRH